MKLKEVFKVASLPVLFASMCCLSPIILVLLGASTVTFATSLTDVLYGDYKWAFRAFGLLLLVGSIVLYLRRQGVCTLDQAKRERNRIINIVLTTLIAGILGYLFFLYVVVHYLGVWLRIWD
jgi:NADH:ubiquinone oxidoreductase subunit 6 (subunit J)